MHEIRADWTVPQILDPVGGSAGESTWIGAEGDARDEPFIQLGTVGFTYSSPSFGSVSSTPTTHTAYEVFWSDTARRYAPIPVVFLRRPGDRISFEMIRENIGWRLTVHNLTVGWSRSVTVRYGVDDSFSNGAWIQEDPGEETPGVDVPYAKTSSVSFSDMTVNGHTPKLGYDNEMGLSTQNGEYLVPSPVVHDGFSMVSPTGAASQYMTDAEYFDSVAGRIGGQMTTWDSHRLANQGQLQTVSQVATLYAASAHQLASQDWPPKGRPAVERLAAAELVISERVEAWTHGVHPYISQVLAVLAYRPEQTACGQCTSDTGCATDLAIRSRGAGGRTPGEPGCYKVPSVCE